MLAHRLRDSSYQLVCTGPGPPCTLPSGLSGGPLHPPGAEKPHEKTWRLGSHLRSRSLPLCLRTCCLLRIPPREDIRLDTGYPSLTHSGGTHIPAGRSKGHLQEACKGWIFSFIVYRPKTYQLQLLTFSEPQFPINKMGINTQLREGK